MEILIKLTVQELVIIKAALRTQSNWLVEEIEKRVKKDAVKDILQSELDKTSALYSDMLKFNAED
jgi:hypothetical protein